MSAREKAIDELHVIPVSDRLEHEAGAACFCVPVCEPVKRDDGSFGWLYIHTAFDGRVECGHDSLTGVDQYFGPGKVMRCDSCDYEETVDWGGDS